MEEAVGTEFVGSHARNWYRIQEILFSTDRFMPTVQSTRSRISSWIVVGSAIVLALIAVLPVLLHWPANDPRKSRGVLAWQLASLVAAAICYLLYKREARRSSHEEASWTIYSIVVLTLITNSVHAFAVDGSSADGLSNLTWQTTLHNHVIQLLPGVLPHSYRFLPNGIVRWMEMSSVPFSTARDIYRFFCNFVLFYTLYRFARLYTKWKGAMTTMLLVAVVYPVSFEGYRGQLTDPFSHASFLLAFFFLATDEFPLFLVTLLIGSMAKETILGLAGFYLLFCRRDRRFAAKSIALAISAGLLTLGIRLYVLKNTLQYRDISNVDPSHVITNLMQGNWVLPLFLTSLVFVPFLVLSWKTTPVFLRNLAVYLLVILFLSSLLFSWLTESRNMMPAVFVTALIAARYMTGPAREGEGLASVVNSDINSAKRNASGDSVRGLPAPTHS